MEWETLSSKQVLSSTKGARSLVAWSKSPLPLTRVVIFVDFDGTLYEMKSRTFPTGPLVPKIDVIEALKVLAAKTGGTVVIVTNQKWNVDPDLIKARLSYGIADLAARGLPLSAIYVSLGDDFYRKPLPGMGQLALDKVPPPEALYMIGDAAGRPGDHSSADYSFAMNMKATFYTPENLVSIARTGNPLIEQLSCPTLGILDGRVKSLGGRPQCSPPIGNPELVVLCGLPGSGKTSLAKRLELLGYIRISADEVSDPLVALDRTPPGRSIVFDRTHYSAAQRRPALEFARLRRMPIRLVCLIEPVIVSKVKMLARTLCGEKYIPSMACNRWNIEPPTASEMFDKVEQIEPIIDLDCADPAFLNLLALHYEIK